MVISLLGKESQAFTVQKSQQLPCNKKDQRSTMPSQRAYIFLYVKKERIG